MPSLLLLALVTLLAFPPVPANAALRSQFPVRKHFYLEIEEFSGAPDGHLRVSGLNGILGVNGSTPGPTLEVDVGDELWVKVLNKLSVATSLHWHGIHQVGSNRMDGVPGVTQAAISPGSTFLYRFKLDVPGTYWYHAHTASQYVDGLRGALIVRDPSASMYHERVIQLTDWYHNTSKHIIEKEYLVPFSGARDPIPVSCLINGIGQHRCTDPAQCAYERIEAVRGTADHPMTKLRIINTAAFAVFNFSIDGHLMRIIAADSTPVHPVTVGSLRINVGQRYDVLVYCSPDAPSCPDAPAWVRAVMEQNIFVQATPTPAVRAILQYTPDMSQIPDTNLDPSLAMVNRQELFGGHIDPQGLKPLKPLAPPPFNKYAGNDCELPFRG
eukprot:gene30205-35189_t